MYNHRSIDACYQQMLKQKAVFRKDLNEALRVAYLFEGREGKAYLRGGII